MDTIESYRGPGIVLRVGELFLKGRNRYIFEEALERNVRRAVAGRDGLRVRREHGRLFVLGGDDEELLGRLEEVAGISSLSPAVFCGRDLDEITRGAVELAQGQVAGKKTFRISARRSDKSFPQTSRELGIHVGSAVAISTGLGVDLEDFDLEVGIEIGPSWVFLWTARRRGAGGLPLGTGGKAMLLLSGGIDSPVAGHLMQRRGIELAALYFHAFPYTGDGAREKVIDLARVLARRQKGFHLYVAPFTRVQEQLRDSAPAPYLVILYRRAMIRVAEGIAARERIFALSTGESLGQVASQTLPNLAAIEDAATLPIIRPLVTYDKADTIELARKIGTYEISIRPHDDCCSLFVPRHPETKGRAIQARRIEDGIDLTPLVDEVIDQAELIEL